MINGRFCYFKNTHEAKKIHCHLKKSNKFTAYYNPKYN